MLFAQHLYHLQIFKSPLISLQRPIRSTGLVNRAQAVHEFQTHFTFDVCRYHTFCRFHLSICLTLQNFHRAKSQSISYALQQQKRKKKHVNRICKNKNDSLFDRIKTARISIGMKAKLKLNCQ